MQSQPPPEGAGPPGAPGPREEQPSPGVPSWKTWQRDSDIPERRNLIHQILKLFQQRKPSVTTEWQSKLPDFVRRLEEALYRSAASKEEYCDVNTLEARLQAVARRMVSRPGVQGENGDSAQQRAQQGVLRGVLMTTPSGSSPTMQGIPMGMQGSQHHVKLENGMPTLQGAGSLMGGAGVALASPHQLGVGQMMAPLMSPAHAGMQQGMKQDPGAGLPMRPQSTGPLMPNPMAGPSGSALMGSSSQGGTPTVGGVNPVQLGGVSGAGVLAPAPGAGAQQPQAPQQQQAMLTQQLIAQQQQMYLAQQQQQQQQQQVQRAQSLSGPPMDAMGAAGTSSSAGAPALNGLGGALPQGGQGQLTSDQQRQRAELERVYIVKQQRWLLFIRHASKCQAPEGRCPYTPHCHVARKLWEHVLNCQNHQCQYPRCVASRELLRHHQRCQDVNCPVCAPVRMAMQKQRQMQLQAMGGADPRLQGALAAAGGQPSAGMPRAPSSSQLGSKRQRTDAGPGAAPAGPAMVERGRAGSLQNGQAEGTSMLECFTPDEIHTHLAALRLGEEPSGGGGGGSKGGRAGGSAGARGGRALDYGASPANVGAATALFNSQSEGACKACGGEKLSFEPSPIYCFNCQARIKRGQQYWLATANPSGGAEVKHHYCQGCYSSALGTSVDVEGVRVHKSQLQKHRNEENMEEPWVQCDRCPLWFHQICVLFNGRRNDAQGGEGAFTCPRCILEGLHDGSRKVTVNRPASQQPASALPETHLSRNLEEYLAGQLQRERAERARQLGRSVEEVPGADNLCIRVVSCADKRLDVKSNFLRVFGGPQGGQYPEAFLYRSKALLLFQRTEGVDVCLFSMYVQEYGADQPEPNTRRVYLSYLDSVKYFRPEVMSARPGVSLRTFVYQAILVGYLAYVKRRGFTSCYIWACPPVPGEDYILYCHPAKQKTPKVDKLREWYLQMLRTAEEDGVVVGLSNLYDELHLGDADLMRSAAVVPYFDGDYWPGMAEETLEQLRQQQGKDGGGGGGKGGAGGSKAIAGAAKGRKGRGRAERPEGSVEALDHGLMCKLAEQIGTMKNDFILAHLWYRCSRCKRTIEDNFRWTSAPAAGGGGAGPAAASSSSASVFEICNDCYGTEIALPPEERFPGKLAPVMVPKLPDTRDPDEVIESELFDTRIAFLSLCQGNHFQFDTLRRAKHSSMMVLYHLHNPSEPAFVATCNVCHKELEPGSGWRCDVCADFDSCDDCQMRHRHPHPLRPLAPSRNSKRAMTDDERRARRVQLQRTMELLVHASACQDPRCKSSNCHKVKQLFVHGLNCAQKAGGGCALCRRMWTLLQVHAKSCQLSQCPVPRCRDLKEYKRRASEKQDTQRRMAFASYRKQAAMDAQGQH